MIIHEAHEVVHETKSRSVVLYWCKDNRMVVALFFPGSPWIHDQVEIGPGYGQFKAVRRAVDRLAFQRLEKETPG